MKSLPLPLVLDGATGTNLMRAGLPANTCVEAWILDQPQAILELQGAFVRAGSRAVMAPTFGANRVKLAHFGLEDRVAELNRRLVALSRQAVGEGVLVAGNMAPTGLFVEPFGDETFDGLTDVFREQAFALKEAGADYIALETMMSLTEARAALLAAKETGLPVTASLTVEQNGRTLSGGSIASGLLTLEAMGAAAVGVNCSTGPDVVLAALEKAAPYLAGPLLAKPNAGLPDENGGGYSVTPEAFASYAPAFLHLGAGLLGGCCGTTAEHIRALAQAVSGAAFTPPKGEGRGAALLAADERRIYPLTREELAHAPAAAAGPELADALIDAAADGATALKVVFEDMDGVAEFTACSYQATLPLILSAGDPAVLEAALRVYQGRALLDPDCKAGEAALRRFAALYGALA